MTIRTMTIDDLDIVLGWAADEGWNPGLDDAPAFLATDPDGFWVKEVNGKPVAAISVVNHSPDFAFLGLYICTPEYRGQGHGMDVWQAGIAHAGARTIGLDGVPDQQENYARSGFEKAGTTVRFEGTMKAASNPRVRLAASSDLPSLVRRDAKATGIDRPAFLTRWLSRSHNRKTLVLSNEDEVSGFATFRRCTFGAKIGPLQASSEADAISLMASNPFACAGEPVFVDVQDQALPFFKTLNELGFVPTFETARMYKGAQPKTELSSYQAIATMELG